MIYFIQQGVAGPIKIGYSATVRGATGRLASLQVAHAIDLHLLGCIEGDRDDEAALHRYFRDWRLRGEWFAPAKRLEQCADQSHARSMLDIAHARERWRDAGWVVNGALSAEGEDYVVMLERTLLDAGFDLDPAALAAA